jgi:iron complex transport system ATP-binding protein
MNVLQTENLTIGYPARTVAENLNLSLHEGELVCLIGPNGAGKSTLMRTLAGMQPPLEGVARLGGDVVHTLAAVELAKRLSIVLTERVNVGQLTAYGLVALGRHPYTDWSGRLSKDDESVVRWAIEAVGAKALAHRYLDELSDGERQKIMIARALAQEPQVMILDEPTAFLDLPRRVEIMQLLRRLTRDHQQAVLLSTHDLDLALRTADTIWLMSSDGGMRVGAPEDLVLNGAFERVFQSEGVYFDSGSGTFQINTLKKWMIAVSGEGVRAQWTRRALERVGYGVTEKGAVCVEVKSDEWLVMDAGQSISCRSIAGVLNALSPLSLNHY